MRSLAPIRSTLLLTGMLATLPLAWSQLPANPATSLSALPIGTAGPVATSAGKTANVSYTGNLLRISASDSSLHQILREVGRLTGMKITGGVPEDRVFGTYGPAPASEVIYSLLDGTQSNVLIVGNASDGPAELILTPRQGGPTPPNPNAVSQTQNDINYDANQQRSIPLPTGRPGLSPIVTGPPDPNGLPPSNGGQTGTPINGGADLGTTPGAFAPYGQAQPDATAQPAVQQTPTPASTTDPSQPQSPNGTSTPQQIYEQLMRLRQQQTNQPQTTTPQ